MPPAGSRLVSIRALQNFSQVVAAKIDNDARDAAILPT
jgi:hypothetical protein